MAALQPGVGIDSVELARMERLLGEHRGEELRRIFSAQELAAAEQGPRAARLAARFAAKEACLKLFTRETALGELGPADFSVQADGYGGPTVGYSARAREVLDRHWVEDIAVSLTHDQHRACAVAIPRRRTIAPSRAGKLLYHCLPIRRRIVDENLRRAFGAELGEAELVALAQAFYGHLWRSMLEFAKHAMVPGAKAAVRVENQEAALAAQARGRGVLIFSGHLGNWEVALVAAIRAFAQYRGRIHILRRPLFPAILDRAVTRRMRRAGLGVIAKRGTLDEIMRRLAAGDAVVFILDQHAGARDGVAVDFFGAPAWTFRSLALLALTTGAPVVPAALWRESDGVHVLRFEEALPTIEASGPDQAVAANTRLYNTTLERIIIRHPEQWIWLHRRWKQR